MNLNALKTLKHVNLIDTIGFRNLNWTIICLIIFPLILVAISDNWIYCPLGHLDPWVYLGYFLDLKQHLRIFQGAYYGTRLPWILPGFLFYKIFSPTTAPYILHLAFYYSALIALFLILKNTIGKRVALLTSILMGGYRYFLYAIGGDYIDGAGLTYLLLTLLMCTYAAKAKRVYPYMMLAGVFCACFIFTQLFLVTFIPLIAVYFCFFNYENRKHSYVLSFLSFISGFVFLMLLLCSIHYRLTGTFFFFIDIINWTSNFLSNSSPYWHPISSWWKQAIWLVLPVLIFIGSLLTLAFHKFFKPIKNYKFIIFFQILFILNIFLYITWEFIIRQPVLNLYYYVSYLFPLMFLALGSQLGLPISRMKRQHYYFVMGFIMVSTVLITLMPQLIGKWTFFWGVIFPIILGIVGLVCFFMRESYTQRLGVILTCSAFIVINGDYAKPYYERKFERKAYLSVIDSVRAIRSMDRKGITYFWYPIEDYPTGNIYRSICSTYLWGYRLINENFPKTKGDFISREPVLNDQIFIISREGKMLEQANRALAEYGFKGKLLKERMIKRDDINFNIKMIKVCQLNEP